MTIDVMSCLANLIADDAMIKHQFIEGGILKVLDEFLDSKPDKEKLETSMWLLGNCLE